MLKIIMSGISNAIQNKPSGPSLFPQPNWVSWAVMMVFEQLSYTFMNQDEQMDEM